MLYALGNIHDQIKRRNKTNKNWEIIETGDCSYNKTRTNLILKDSGFAVQRYISIYKWCAPKSTTL